MVRTQAEIKNIQPGPETRILKRNKMQVYITYHNFLDMWAFVVKKLLSYNQKVLVPLSFNIAFFRVQDAVKTQEVLVITDGGYHNILKVSPEEVEKAAFNLRRS